MGHRTQRPRKGFLFKGKPPAHARKRPAQLHTKGFGPFSKKFRPRLRYSVVDGHTDKQMLPHLRYKGKTLVFVADLIPTVGHIPLPYVMGYDTRPLLTLEEKEVFLNKALTDDYLLFFEHDAHNEICTLKSTERGIRLDKTYTFDEVFNS